MSKVDKIVEKNLSERQNLGTWLQNIKEGYGYFTASYVDEGGMNWEDILMAIRNGKIKILTLNEGKRMNLSDLEYIDSTEPILFVV